jgi:phage tail sheath protein FI
MSEADIRDGHVICQVGIAPAKPSEFVFYRIRIRLQPLQKPLAVA